MEVAVTQIRKREERNYLGRYRVNLALIGR